MELKVESPDIQFEYTSDNYFEVLSDDEDLNSLLSKEYKGYEDFLDDMINIYRNEHNQYSFSPSFEKIYSMNTPSSHFWNFVMGCEIDPYEYTDENEYYDFTYKANGDKVRSIVKNPEICDSFYMSIAHYIYWFFPNGKNILKELKKDTFDHEKDDYYNEERDPVHRINNEFYDDIDI